MRQFKLTRPFLGRDLTAQVLVLERGIHVSLFGGDLPHIGAVSVADPNGTVTTQEFSGHKEGGISTQWAKALAAAGFCPAVVTAGIHYDDLSRDGIVSVVSLTEQMLLQVLEMLKNDGMDGTESA
jgi:hypothetical protein